MASKAAMDKFRLKREVRVAAGLGWRLFPIKAGDKRPPLLKNWPAKASRDLGQLEEWAGQFPKCNWGMATGSDSKVFVLDVDGEKGKAALLAFRRQGQELPATLMVTTGSGIHLYFRWPSSHSIRNSARKLAQGLDIRGEGGYVVIPPSVHPNGKQYAFDDPDRPIADAPGWFLLFHAHARIVGNPAWVEALGQGRGAPRSARFSLDAELARPILAEPGWHSGRFFGKIP